MAIPLSYPVSVANLRCRRNGQYIMLFPTLTGGEKGRCVAFTAEAGFTTVPFDLVMRHTRKGEAKTRKGKALYCALGKAGAPAPLNVRKRIVARWHNLREMRLRAFTRQVTEAALALSI